MQKILFLFLFLALNCFGQNKDFSLQQIEIADAIFSGSIDEKHEITIYLKKYKNSDSHKAFYSLKGWYYYDKYEIKIPVVGIYSPFGKLTLYVLNDSKTEEEIANLTFKEHSIFWDQIEDIENISNFKEKFVFDSNSEDKKWVSNNKTLKLQLYNFYKIYQFTSSNSYFLHFQDNVIDLSNYGVNSDEMEILVSSIDQNKKKCILSFSDSGSHNYAGMCGGATDTGLIYLCFDKNNNLEDFKFKYLDHCKLFISSEELINDKNIIKYKVKKYDEKSETVTVDLNSVKITIN